jgi:hypothetical protein
MKTTIFSLGLLFLIPCICLSQSSTYNINGYLLVSMYNNINMDHGKMVIFQKNGTAFNYYKTFDVDSVFSVPVDSGTYILLFMPSITSKYFSQCMPTYFRDSLIWQSAELINVTSSDAYLGNMRFQSPPICTNTTWNLGTDSIKGSVEVYGDGVARMTAYSSSSLSAIAPNALVTLNDLQGQRLSFTYSDASGNFSFGKLAAGTYSIQFEYGGTIQASAYNVNVDGNPSTISNLPFTLNKQGSVAGISNSYSSFSNSLTLSPNPADNIITLSLNNSSGGDAMIRITNTMGDEIKAFTCTYNSREALRINLEGLSNGIYTMQFILNGNIYIRKFCKF